VPAVTSQSNLQIVALLSFAGSIAQAAVAILLAGLFYVLSRHSGRRPYTIAWSWAWVALVTAITAVVVSYHLTGLEAVLPGMQVSSGAAVACYVLYLFAKLVFAGLLLAGTLAFCGRPLRRGVLVAGLIASAGLALVLGLVLRSLDRMVVVQTALIVPAFLASAWQLLRLPPPRRGLGTRITGGVFLLQSLLWLLYALAFALVWRHSGDPAYLNPFASLIRVNSFIDTLVEMLLAFGMIAMLNEQARHEADEERAARLRDLAESGERLAAVIRGANDAIVMLDGEGRVLLSNAAADQMFAGAGTQLPGRLLAGCIAEAELPGFGAWLAARPGGEAGPRTLLGLRPDGTPFTMEASAADVSLGGVSHRLLVIRDITTRERAESERLELQRRLAQFEKTEALGRLVSGITHELNNPLAAILAAIGDLLEDSPPERERKALAAIQEQAQRCRLITRNLVYFVRGGEGRREVVDPATLVAHAVEGLRQEAGRQGVTLTLVTPATTPSLVADPVALEQVVANLTLNAIEASGGGRGGRVRVALAAGDGKLTLTVTDNGPGISPVLLPRIFDPFFTRKPLGRGSGLGLPVALGILQHHNGSLVAENVELPERGARFVAQIPLALARRSAAPPAVEERRRLRESRRALIIDDEAPVRNPIRRFLERRGWTVEEAEDGTLGLARLLAQDGQGFDLILSDLKMPGLSGLELHDRLLKDRPELMARLVFITGDVVSSDVAEFLRKTARPVLEKPFELSELDVVVERVVGRPD
jgi:PAS domain S-box-containing protein